MAEPQPTQPPVQDQVENNENGENNTIQPPLRGRKRSVAWDHFTPVKAANGKSRASCNYCGQTYACDTRVNGTKSMLHHIEAKCKKYKKPEDLKQKTLSFMPSVDGDINRGLVPVAFSVDACKNALAEMIIIDELPFKFVENEGFRKFIHIAVPRWTTLPNRNMIKEECLKVYGREKAKLKRCLRGQRVCLTTDTWTSVQNLNYMCLTAHFIDSDWNYQKRILNFGIVENHKGDTLGRVMEDWLHDWRLDKILTITVDNAASNNLLINYIKRRTSNRSGTLLKHEFLHMRCCAHILNLIVKEGLKEYDISIARIRTAVKYVRSSPQRYRTFKECARKEQITNGGVVCMDVPTRWNYTYLMLEKALIFKKAFKRLDEDDPGLGMYLLDEKVGFLDSDDWEKANLFFKYLKIFYDATCKFSGSKYVTLNSFFGEIVLIQETINLYCTRHVVDDVESPLKAMAQNMKTKFLKYWGNLDKMNLLLYMGIVLDPRFKVRYRDFQLKKLFGKEEGQVLTDKICVVLNRLYEAYIVNDSSSGGLDGESEPRGETSGSRNNDVEEEDLRASMLSQFTSHLREVNSNVRKSDVEKYLSEDNEDPSKPLDILMWWKTNATRFSVLSLVARDVLAVPVSTVASESVFSTGGRVIDQFRSSLAPSTVEALICTQNWLRSSPIDLRGAMDELEELEKDLDASPIMEEDNPFDITTFDVAFTN